MNGKIVGLMVTAIVVAGVVGGVFAFGGTTFRTTHATTPKHIPLPVTIDTYYVTDSNGDSYQRDGVQFVICADSNSTGTVQICQVPQPTFTGVNSTAVTVGFSFGTLTMTLSGTYVGTPFTFQSGYSYTVEFVTSQNNLYKYTYQA